MNTTETKAAWNFLKKEIEFNHGTSKLNESVHSSLSEEEASEIIKDCFDIDLGTQSLTIEFIMRKAETFNDFVLLLCIYLGVHHKMPSEMKQMLLLRNMLKKVEE